MSDTSIMSVGDLIDSAFGDPDVNTVNFKLIQTVLLLIARQLSILERFVAVKIGYPIVAPSGSRLSIREVKLHAVVPKKDKKRKKGAKSSGEKDYIALDDKTPKSKSARKHEDSNDQSSVEKEYRGTFAADKSNKKKSDKKKEQEDLDFDEDNADDQISQISKGKSYVGEKSTRKGESEPGEERHTKGKEEGERGERRKRRESKERGARASKQNRDGTYTTDERQRREKDEFSDEEIINDGPTTRKSVREKSAGDKSRTDKLSHDRSPTSSPSEDDERYEKKFRKYSSQSRSEDGKRGNKSEYGKRGDKTDDDRKGNKTEYGKGEDKSEDGGRAEKIDKYAENSGKIISHGERDDVGKSENKKSGRFLKMEERDFETSDISLESEQKSTDKRSPDKTGKAVKGLEKTDKTSLKGTDSRVSSTATTGSKRKKYQQLLEKLEEERERVLRVIHQRADSHEEHSQIPTPMASISSTDLQQEKLLIVEKISSDHTNKGAESLKGEKRKGKRHGEEASRMSVVTQDQFQRLMHTVKDLESKFGPLDFPFLDDLRKGVPLSDALAGLQLASRLEATEKALGRMINIMTDIATKTPGVNVKSFTDLKEEYGDTVTKLRTESHHKFHTGPTSVFRVEIGDKPGWVSNTGADTGNKMKTISSKPSETVSMVSAPMSVAANDANGSPSAETGLWDVTKKTYITAEEMETAIQSVYEDYTTLLTNWTNRTSQKADAAYQMCTRMESDLAKSLAVEKKMNELEEKIQSYVERINILDTGLSTQMINYQEQLTQMQHDLETGLDNMAEALATQTGDTEAMGELNQNFTILQSDFDRTRVMQKDLSDIQEIFAIDLTALKKQIEMLREVKSDRDEVADALRDKAGLSALNGLVGQVQFDAVQGDLEKRIRHAYDKFNSQEVVWQRAIDDLIREINEKATVQQVDFLREEIQSKINVLKERLDYMLDILGEPSAAAVKKQLFRDTECLSCSTPAKMKMGEPGAPEPVGPEPRQSYKKSAGEGVEVGKAVGDGDHVPCIPGLPPPHPIDPRAEFCTRYCGGRHTIFSHAYKAAPTELPNININQLTRETRTAIGDDGKVYKVDYEVKKKPCHPCNVPKIPAKDDHRPKREKWSRQSSSSMGTPSDLRAFSELLTTNRRRGADTPQALE